MFVEIFMFVALLLVYAVVKDSRPKGMPPGPLEIPFIGNYPVETTQQLESLRKKYGDICTTRTGVERMVIVSDYKTAKDLMAHPDCSDRTPLFKLFALDPEEAGGVIASNGLQWVHDRRFVLRHLRDLGMGKTRLEVAIHEEAKALVEDLKKLKEEPSDFPISLRTAVLNVVWQLVASKRYDLHSTDVVKVFQLFEEFRERSMLVFLEVFFPITKKLPSIVKHTIGSTAILDDFRRELKKLMQDRIEEHKQQLDVDNPRDLIDDYLIEMKNSDDGFCRTSALYQIISDLFAAGSDTVTNMLRWVVHIMAQYPDVVALCQQEIDREIPCGNLVSILDKPRLPYVEAFTAEALRFASLIPFNVQRHTTKDISVLGYTIPKDTAVTVNSYFVHFDPSFWKDPETFNPSRFIDENGKFQQRLGRSFAFGSGKRQCLGEPLAKMEFFLFAAALLQNFTVELPEGVKPKPFIEAVGVRAIDNQKFIYKARNVK